MSQDKIRILKLIEHWIEHNIEHTNRFRITANEALELRLIDVAESIRKAANKSDEVTENLKKALESFK